MNQNEIWDLVELLEIYKKVGCKWIFKTKRDTSGNIERYKVRLWPKVSLRKEALIIKRPSLLYQRRTS